MLMNGKEWLAKMANKYGKVWGTTFPLLVTPTIEIHHAFIKGNFKCSEHKHEFKWNGFFCISGTINIHVRKNDYELVDITTLYAGDFTSVRPNEYHWFETSEEDEAEILEIYYPQHITDDIVRKTVGGYIGE